MLNNIYWSIPEIILIINLNILLITYLIFSKLQTQLIQKIKFIWLIIFLLLIVSLLYFEQLNLLHNIYIYISFNFFLITPFSLLFKLIICFSTMIILLLSQNIYITQKIKDFEYLILISLALLGMVFLMSSNNLILFYLSLELFSLSLYILATIQKNSEYSTEAGLKYFVLGSLSSGLLLLGISILYLFTGELNIDNITYFLWYNNNIELILGATFIIIAILFKLAAAPFHMWAPDVYEGVPTIITAFFAIVPKIATLGILINFTNLLLVGIFTQIQPVFIISAILSLIIGSIGALNQTKIKRLIAYSAINHIGFLLIGIISGTIISFQMTIIYLFIYILMNIGIFTCILTIFNKTNYISELSGLSRKNPVLASTFAIILFSMAGLPPLAGFFSKYLILIEAISNGLLILAIIAIFASSIAAFYYIRIIKWMFFKDSNDYYFKDLGDIIKPQIYLSLSSSIILSSSLFFIITLLFYPNFLLNFTYEILIYSLL